MSLSLSAESAIIRRILCTARRFSQHEFLYSSPQVARAMTSSRKNAFTSLTSVSPSDQSPPLTPPSEVRRRPRVTPPSQSLLLSTSNNSTNNYGTANSRLSLISRHFQTTPQLDLNTPYTIERSSTPDTDLDQPPATKKSIADTKNPSPHMSSQPPHAAVLISGPIEYDDEVLQAMSHFSESHVGMPFVNTFGDTLSMLRKIFQTENPASQPFVLSGSGTLGWDQVAANLVERDEDVLVLHTGYFADSFADCFETYGSKPTQLKAEIGSRPQLPEIEKALKEKKYKLITVTHVDTSTGVLSEVKELTKMVRRVSPGTLVIVDGVCSVGAEDIRFDEWDLDVVMTASQKAIGCPAGLCILMASGRAMEVFKNRKTRPTSYFGSWKNWLPIMQNYEAKKPSYFATPSPQLIHALHTTLTQILSRPLSDRFARHREVSQHIKSRINALGLKQLASDPANQASTMTAIYLPEGMIASDFLPGVTKKGVIFAGGLHKAIATKYVRFGHMGVSVMDEQRDDVERALKALEERLEEMGYKKP